MFGEINAAQLAVLEQVRLKYYSDYETDHTEYVCKLSLKLFDLLVPLLGWPSEGRNLMYTAAMLHDVGHYINEKRHDRHSYYIILNESLLNGWPEAWRVSTALLAGSHRKKMHPGLEYLEPSEQATLTHLAAIMRIADALDYFHGQDMDISSVEVNKENITIRVTGPEFENLRTRLANKSKLMQKCSERQVVFEEAGA